MTRGSSRKRKAAAAAEPILGCSSQVMSIEVEVLKRDASVSDYKEMKCKQVQGFKMRQKGRMFACMMMVKELLVLRTQDELVTGHESGCLAAVATSSISDKEEDDDNDDECGNSVEEFEPG
ncbi:unnamed protein product [Linum tenue]|uniref:Uncharacterized protein n=1 Tax=Linum tenue TaxID=586396 RepID=A0AAV0N3Y8_9ROSI|nr:unnamed protein product [Linum tenue]